MATRHDIKLTSLLERKSRKWREQFNGFEDGSAEALTAHFTKYETRKRFLILSYMDTVQLGEGGVLLDNAGNREELTRLLRDLSDLELDAFGPDSSFAKWVNRNFDRAADLGVRKARDVYKIGEGRDLPRRYSPPPATFVEKAKALLLTDITDRHAMDLDLVRKTIMRKMLDPTGTVQSLRKDLVNRGQIEGFLDSAGRRISASERADRIARYELAEVAEQHHVEMVNRIYNDGKSDPKNTFYLWDAVMDDRVSASHARRNGKVLSEYQWERKDWGDGQYGLPPTRPRCRCDAIHVRPEWFSPDTRQKMFNADDEPSLFEVAA